LIDKKAILEKAYKKRLKQLFIHLCDRVIDAKTIKDTRPYEGFIQGVATADAVLKHAMELLECSNK
jgi:hypothetical protein